VRRFKNDFFFFQISTTLTLQRASSVPTRATTPDKNTSVDSTCPTQTQSQQQSIDIQLIPPLTPSTTEESVETQAVLQAATTTSTSAVDGVKKVQVSAVPAKLPGITPVRGHLHKQGWL
jgi:hypothetical protein